MSRNTNRCTVRASELIDELSIGAAQRLKCDSDDVHTVVKAVVAYLIDAYPAQDLYIPASFSANNYPVDEIRKAVQRGDSIRSICGRYHLDRRTLYRLLNEHEMENSDALETGKNDPQW